MIILALGTVFLVLVILDEAEKEQKKQADENKTIFTDIRKPVTIINVSPITSHAIIQSFGEVKPRWNTVIKAKKRGEILSISKNLDVGKKVKKGEVLFSFDNTHYQTLLAEAHNRIAQAELLLHSEKEQSRRARQDWKIFQKKGNPTAFILRIPQIKVAKTQLNLAKANFNEVRKKGAYSKIIAPYNGVVLIRSVSVGDVAEAGQVLAEIISGDSLDIVLKLNSQQWNLLGKKWKGKVADVFVVNETSDSRRKWTAILEREGGVIDKKTRQRLLHLKLSSPHKPLSGSFVRVEIRGKKIYKLLKIPQGSLTPQGFIWQLDKDNKLRRFKAFPQFHQGQNTFVKVPSGTKKKKSYSIVKSPLASFIPGIEVIAKKNN